jgi:hypothetical protein
MRIDLRGSLQERSSFLQREPLKSIRKEVK